MTAPLSRKFIAFCSPPFAVMLLCVAPALSDDSAALTNAAAKAWHNKQYEEAIKLSTAAIKLNPKDGDAYICRATCSATLERLESAARDFDIGLKLSPPNHFYVYFVAAGAYVSVGEYDKALNALDKSIALKPTSIAYRQKGQVLWTLKRTDDALKNFAKAIQLEPKNSYWPLFDRASCFIQAERLPEALKDLNRLIEMRPEQPRGYASRAKVYKLMGKADLAAADMKRAEDLGITGF